MPKLRPIASRAGLMSTPTIMCRADQPRALDDVEADAAEPEHHHVAPGSTLAVHKHRADAGGDAAAEVTDRL
jgi:hypothetical protein